MVVITGDNRSGSDLVLSAWQSVLFFRWGISSKPMYLLYMRLVHLKTGHFGEKKITSYTLLFVITITPGDQLWSYLVFSIWMAVHTFNLRHERALGCKYFQSSDNLNHIIGKPAVVLVFKWTSLIYSTWTWDLPCIWNHIGTQEKWPPSGR